MTHYEIISCSISAFAAVVATIAVFFTYKNLREIKEQFFEQNRGNLIFFIDQIKSSTFYLLVLKNFGNSPAKLLSLSIEPDLVWHKTKIDFLDDVDSVSSFENVFLAPNQAIISEFDFDDYPDEIFKVRLKYITCGRTIKDSYTIDFRFSNSLISTGPISKNGSEKESQLEILRSINESIQSLVKRFL